MNALCRHVGDCGGCTLQGVPEAEYRASKRDAVMAALARYGVKAEVGAIVTVPAATRRRAVLNVIKRVSGVEVGFHPLKSHAITDMHECLVLTPGLFALAGALRETMGSVLNDGQDAEARATQCDNGIDIAFRAQPKLTPALTTALSKIAPRLGAIRITWNARLVYESAAPTIRLGKADVKLPADTFLQPSREGEAALTALVLAAVGKAKSVADLFCGCGTFTLPLAERAKVHAVEREQHMLDALAAAARATSGLKPITTARRDLFKVPLAPNELNIFDAVALDPPRAGAFAQAQELAKSKVARIAYVSCDADNFARDAAVLVAGGYKIGTVTPVDQFLWSSHIELVAAFAR